MTNPVRIVPLGGLGEVGKNMMAVEHGDDIVVIDAGVMFPKQDMHGVDLVLPDTTYLLERADRVRAVLITHGTRTTPARCPTSCGTCTSPSTHRRSRTTSCR